MLAEFRRMQNLLAVYYHLKAGSVSFMRILYYTALACVLTSLAIVALPYFYASPLPNSTSLAASVSVACPFYLKFNIPPSYIRGFNAIFNYTAYPLENCSLPSASGYFQAVNSSGNISINNSISSVSITNSIRNHNVSIKNLTLPEGLYTAHINLTDISTNSSSQAFTVLLPPDIIKIMAHLINPINQYSIQTAYINYTNIGNLAALNASLNMRITGPVNLTLNRSVGNMPPSSENISITLPQNATSKLGAYALEVNFTYTLQGKIYHSANSTLQYTVVAPPVSTKPRGAPISSIVTPVYPIPSLSFTSMPLYLTLLQGGSATSSISLLNTGNLAEILNISIPRQFSSMLNLSSTTVTLAPHQSLSDSMYLNVNSTLPASTYIIPITINITAPSGLTSTYREFITLDVAASAPGEPSADSQLYLENNTHTAYGIAEITAPSNTQLDNATIDTIIPIYATNSMQNINAYGLPNKIITTNAGYEIQWSVSHLPEGESTYGYYEIRGVTNPQALMAPVQSVSFYSSSVQPKFLNVLSIDVPTFYANSINNITVNVLYTGGAAQDVSLSLSGPITQRLENPNVLINATPNQVISSNFHIKTGNFTGTLLLYLHISTFGESLNYSLPALVMPLSTNAAKPPTQAPTTTYAVFKGFISYINANIYMIAYAAAIIVVIVALAAASKRSHKRYMQRYSKERAKQLVELREHIKRGYDSETVYNKDRIAKRRRG